MNKFWEGKGKEQEWTWSWNTPRNKTKRKPEETKRWNRFIKSDEREDKKPLKEKKEDGFVGKLVLEEMHKPLQGYKRKAVKELLPLRKAHCYQHNSLLSTKTNPGSVAYQP